MENLVGCETQKLNSVCQISIVLFLSLLMSFLQDILLNVIISKKEHAWKPFLCVNEKCREFTRSDEESFCFRIVTTLMENAWNFGYFLSQFSVAFGFIPNCILIVKKLNLLRNLRCYFMIFFHKNFILNFTEILQAKENYPTLKTLARSPRNNFNNNFSSSHLK